MNSFFARSVDAVRFAVAAVKIAFVVPLQSKNVFEDRIDQFWSDRRRARA